MMQYDESENMLFDLKITQIQNEAKYRLDDLDIRKKELQNCNAERDANNMLAIAQAKKYEAEAKIAAIMVKVTLMREHKKLLDDGHSQSEVDLVLPLE